MSPMRRPPRGRAIRVESADNQPTPARALAMELVRKAGIPDAPGLDALLDEARQSGLYRQDDLALAREIAMGVCRRRPHLEAILARYLHRPLPDAAHPVQLALLIGIYQAVFLDRVPVHTVVDETVRLVGTVRTEKAYRGLANAIMRRVVGEDRSTLAQGMGLPWTTLHGVPDWLAGAAGQVLPTEEIEPFFAANSDHAPLSLRRVEAPHVPPLDELAERLRAELVDQTGRVVEVAPGRVLPGFLLVNAPGIDPGRLPSFQAGFLTAEDEGAAVVGHLAGAAPGMRILDLCAAPGGKTSQLADLAGRAPARFVATDVSPAKLSRLRSTLNRLQLDDMVETRLAAQFHESEPPEGFDLVLVDAPCGGLGTLRRHPEVRWRRTGKQFRSLVRLQREILSNAVRHVAPGGELVYSVCTFNHEETDRQVGWFVNEFPNFKLDDEPAGLPFDAGKFSAGQGKWRTFTHRHGCDSFFVARLRRME